MTAPIIHVSYLPNYVRKWWPFKRWVGVAIAVGCWLFWRPRGAAEFRGSWALGVRAGRAALFRCRIGRRI